IKLVSLKKDDWIFGIDQAKAPSPGLYEMVGDKYKAAGAAVDVDPATSEYDTTTGKLTVTFKGDLQARPPAFNATSSAWGELTSVTGADMTNTDEGKLYVTVRASKLVGTWNTYFYKTSQKRDADLVAESMRNRAGSSCRARAQNHSGLDIRFKMGASPE